MSQENGKTLDITALENWLWDCACSIRGAVDAPKFKDYILPLVFAKRMSDVFDDEITRLAEDFGDLDTALEMADDDRKLIRFWVPEAARWEKIRTTTSKIGETLTDAVRALAKDNPELSGVIDIVDFNATISGERIVGETKLSSLIENISKYRLGLKDVEPDILGRAYEYLLRKFAEGQGKSAGEIYTPKEVAWIMAYVANVKEGEEVYDPCCGSGGLLIKAELTIIEKAGDKDKVKKPARLYGQELGATTFAMAKMNMILHDMAGNIAIGDTMRNPKFLDGSKLKRFDVVMANPMWNQNEWDETFYDADPHERFKFGYPPGNSADWGWVQHMYSSLKENGRAAIVLDTNAVSRGSGNQVSNKEKNVRSKFVDNDLIEGVLLLPENLFYNTPAPGIVLFLNRAKPKERKGKILLVNASQEFEKGRPKNFITQQGIKRISSAFMNWTEEEKFSKVITTDEAVNNDYNLSPSRYIETAEAKTHRSIGHILYDLEQTEKDAQRIDGELAAIFVKLGLKTEAYDA